MTTGAQLFQHAKNHKKAILSGIGCTVLSVTTLSCLFAENRKFNAKVAAGEIIIKPNGAPALSSTSYNK